MALKLLIRPQPLPEESLYSWLARITENNVFRNRWRILVLARAIGLSRRASTIPILDDGQIGRLSKLTRCTPTSIKAMVWEEIRGSDSEDMFSRQFLFTHRAKVCPKCLESKGYWVKSWQILPVTCCIEHGLKLVSSCKCGIPIDIYPYSVSKCVCGRRLSKQKRIDATPFEINIAEFLNSAMCSESSNTLLNRLYEIQFCLWLWYQSVRGHDNQLIRSWNYRRVVNGCKYVGSLIDNLKIDIGPLMKRYVESRTKNDSRFRSVLGDCHDYMNRIVERGYTGEMSEQLVNFEESGWRGAKSLRRSRYGANSFLKTKKEVANDYQCKQDQVERLIEYGDINLAQKNGRTELVDTSNSFLIKESIAAWLSLDDAAVRLNISKDWVVQLVESKLIDGRKNSNQRDWLIARKSCDFLVDQLKLKSVVEGNYLVTLKYLQLLPDQNFSQIIKACLDQKVSFKISDNNAPLLGLRVDCRYIKKIELKEKGELLSAIDLTGYLGVNLNAIYYLVSKKYINVRLRYCRNRKVYGFYLEDIDDFKRKYCFHYEAKNYLILNERIDLLPAIKSSNKRCRHRSKVRIYKWQYITALLNKASTGSKLTRLLRLEAAANFVGRSSAQLHSFLEREWIVPYKAPSHHSTGHRFIEFCITDLKMLKVLLDDYPDLIPIRAASKCIGYDRSHIRKQFICSGYLSTKVVPEYPKELFCFKREVFSLKRLLSKTVTGPELSKIMGVTRNTIYKWMKSGKLRPALTPNDVGFGCYRYRIPKNIIGNKGGNSSMQK